MILIEENKYSCIECIRGHRSSSCRHHTRPLLQVRSKGRPNVHANGNPNHRIAVFAEEIAEEPHEIGNYKNDKGSAEKGVKGGCRNKKNPVVILKTSPKQVIDLTNGEIVGLYKENNIVNDQLKPPAPVINSSSFINTSSCCSKGIKKPNKSCGCSVNKSKSIGKSKILRTYLKNHLKENKEDNEWKFIDYSKDLKVKIEPNESSLGGDKSIESLQGKVFDVVSIPSCSIPGSCCCNDDCSCEGCEVHNGNNTTTATTILSKILAPEYDLNGSNNLQENENLVFSSLESNLTQASHINSHSTIQPSSGNSGNSYFSNPVDNTSLENFANIFYKSSSAEEEAPSTPGTCFCPDDACECSNCETHGIINGMKLDDLFQSNFDPKLFSTLVYGPNEMPSWSGPEAPSLIVENPPKSSGCCSKVNSVMEI